MSTPRLILPLSSLQLIFVEQTYTDIAKKLCNILQQNQSMVVLRVLLCCTVAPLRGKTRAGVRLHGGSLMIPSAWTNGKLHAWLGKVLHGTFWGLGLALQVIRRPAQYIYCISLSE